MACEDMMVTCGAHGGSWSGRWAKGCIVSELPRARHSMQSIP